MSGTPTFGPTASPAVGERDMSSPAFQDRPPQPPSSVETPKTILNGDFSLPSPSTNEESPRISSDHNPVVLGSPPVGNCCNAISIGRPVEDFEQLFASGSKTPHPNSCLKITEPITPQPSTAPSKLNYDGGLRGFPDTQQTHDIPLDKINSLDNSQKKLQSDQSRSSQPLESVDPTPKSRPTSSPPSSDICYSSPMIVKQLDYEILLRYVCPLKIIKMHILPPFSQRMLHESEEKGVLEIRKHLENFSLNTSEDITIFEPDCDRIIESRIRLLLSRFLKYAGMDPKLAAEFVRETCRWMSYEGYVSLSYNFVSPCLYESGFELITSTKQRLPNTPRLLVISGQARQLKSVLMRAIIAYWLFRVGCDTALSIEIDCSQTELNTIKLILENIFIVFERLALEPTELIMANLEGTDCAGAEGTIAIPPILLTKDKTPQYSSRFMKHARIDRLTRYSSSPYTAFETEVEVNDIPNAKNNILPVYDSKATEDLESQIMLSHAMTETQWPIEKYRVLRLSFSAITSYKPMVQPVWRGSVIDSTIVTTDTDCNKVGDAFEQWLRDLIIHEISIPIKITSNTMFDEQQGSATVYNNGVWETYIFGRDKTGRINICINDLTLMNLEFIGFLIIWTYKTLLKMPIGRCELINILINYHGLTLLNKRLSQLLQFLNLFYNSCINKIYIFNTTFINRTVLQTAIKGSKQGGGGVTNSFEGGANRKTIPVIIVTEDIRSEISSQQRQYQFGIGKQRVKMSSTGTNLPMAFFPSRN